MQMFNGIPFCDLLLGHYVMSFLATSLTDFELKAAETILRFGTYLAHYRRCFYLSSHGDSKIAMILTEHEKPESHPILRLAQSPHPFP